MSSRLTSMWSGFDSGLHVICDSSMFTFVILEVRCTQPGYLINTPISKNVVGENDEWQLSTENNFGFHIWYAKTLRKTDNAVRMAN